MGWVSDEAFEAVAAGVLVTRERRREIQRMTREQLQRYLCQLYRMAFEDGAEAVETTLREKYEPAQEVLPFEEVTVDWDDVMAVIAEVKGIGPQLLRRIDDKLKEKY